MKLATFDVLERTGPTRRVGAKTDDGILDVTAGYERLLDERGEGSPRTIAEATVPPDVIDFLSNGQRALEAATEAVASLSPDDEGVDGAQLFYDPEEVRLRSPVPVPNSIRQFSLFKEHASNTESYAAGEDLPDVWYELPLFWKGNRRSVVHPGEDLERPSYTTELDCELEICAVIGREGRDVPVEDAADYLAGYTIHNDWSARDMQRRERGRGIGPSKSKDFAYTFGPYLVTPDDLDTENLHYTVEVNDEVLVDRTLALSSLQHSFEEVIAFVSRSETVYPGDVLITGGVPDCGPSEVGAPFLEPGDEVALTVGGIGTLRNAVV